MLFAGYQFEGPHPLDGTNWEGVPAVYVILDNKDAVIDVGETDNLKDRLANHERRPCWERNCDGEIFVAARKEDSGPTRRRIEGEIREEYDPPCGEE